MASKGAKKSRAAASVSAGAPRRRSGPASASLSRPDSAVVFEIAGQRYDRARLWRLGTATVAALLAFFIVSNGFIVGVPDFQTGIFPGLVAGLVAGGLVDALTASLVASVLGLVLATPWHIGQGAPLDRMLPMDLTHVAITLLVAAAAGWAASRKWGKTILVGVALVYLIVNLAWSTSLVNNIVYPDTGSLNQRLDKALDGKDVVSDANLFQYTYQRVKQGQGYYEAFRAAYEQPTYANTSPTSVFHYRLPTITWLWAALAPTGSAIPWIYMAFAVLGILAAFFLAVQFVEPGLALVGAAAITVYCYFAATANVVTYVEFWAFPLALAGVALFAYYARARDGGRWALWTAVALVAAATLTRELMVFVPLAALAASWFGLKGPRRTEALVAWGVGIGVFIVGYGAHAYVASQHLAASGGGLGQWGQGGFRHLWLSINYAQEFVALNTVMPAVLVILGIFGAALIRDRTVKILLLLAIVAPLAGFLVVGGGFGHQEDYWGGYWGAVVVPIALACVPMALGLTSRLFGVAPRAPWLGDSGAIEDRRPSGP